MNRIDPDRWELIERLYNSALELDPGKREAFLKDACAGDEAVMKAVRRLLDHHEEAEDFFNVTPLDALEGMQAKNHTSLLGKQISTYKVVSEIGRGGMGEVYQATDLTLERDVAIKVLIEEFSKDDERVQRFKREAKLLASLSHPNIAAIYGLEESEGNHFLAMELVEGDTLADRISAGPIPVQEALELAIQIAEALEAAHEKGVIHRDLKPANIKINMDGKVKVLDFGLAKSYTESHEDTNKKSSSSLSMMVSHQGLILGTPAYMSPEQAKGQNVDPRSDIFSFGIIFYEMLTGIRPFEAPSSPEILHAIINEQAPRLSSSGKRGIVADLQRILNKCLAKNPDERYRTALNLVDDLRTANQYSQADSIAWRYTLDIIKHPLKRPFVTVSSAIAVILIIALTVISFYRNSKIQWAEETALPEMERLIEADNYPDAFDLASQAERYIPGNPVFKTIWPRVAQIISVKTEPSGAGVYFKAYSDTDRKDTFLGFSPIEKIKRPWGPYWLRIEKDGYEIFSDLFSGPGEFDLPETVHTIEIELAPQASIPSDMVKIPPCSVSLSQLGGFPVERRVLQSYLIDKHEVSNIEYKKFIDSGGYKNPEYWENEFVYEGRTIPFAEAMSKFLDKSGQPGPSIWEKGSFPEGEEHFPVSGVSWYEAAAYAKYAGKALPTIYHWLGATDTDLASWVIPISNFRSQGPQAVAQGPVGPRGTYDMAGNVKEWCLNETNDQRLILGGGWDDSGPKFYGQDHQSPFDRSETFGFRCMQYLDSDQTYHRYLQQPIQVPVRKPRTDNPVSDEVFNVYKTLYDYIPTDLDAKPGLVDESSPYWDKLRITFRAAYLKDRVVAYLFIPKEQNPPFQTVVYFPGISATLQRTSLQTRIIDFLVTSGRAVIYPIYKGTHERYEADLPQDRSTRTYADYVTYWINDLRRSIDYLETRDDIDMTKLAYFGYSWGGEIGPLALVLEKRFDLGIILDGGLDLRMNRPEWDNLNFAPRVNVPVLMINGKYDHTFPVETTQKPLFDLLGTPKHQKKHVTFECTHDTISFFRNQVIKEILGWLDKNFGKP